MATAAALELGVTLVRAGELIADFAQGQKRQKTGGPIN